MKVLLSLAVTLLALGPAAYAANSGAPALRTSPDIAKGLQAFPRLEGDTKAAAAINQALAAADAQVAGEAKGCIERFRGQRKLEAQRGGHAEERALHQLRRP